MDGNPIGETMVPAWPSSQSPHHTRYTPFEKGSGLKVHHPMMKMKMKMKMKMIHPSASSWRHKVENTMMLVCFWKVTCSWGSWFRLLAVSTYSKDLIYHDWNLIITHDWYIKWRHMPHRSQKASWTLPAARPGSQLDHTWLQLNLHIYIINIYIYNYV